MKTGVIICLYLLTIVIANLSAAKYGYKSILIVGFLLIPFDLFVRDILHERFRGRGLYWKLGLLIFTGAVISFVINVNALRVGVASLVSFTLAGIVDTVIYQKAYEENIPKITRMNMSNLGSSVVDSFVFINIVFFPEVHPLLIGMQTVLKFTGGLFWTYLYKKYTE